jgi:hypothetical protein
MHAYWFTPMPATRLAIVRILIAGFALWTLWSRQNSYQRIAESSVDLFRPVGLIRFLDHALDPGLHSVMYLGTMVLCACATLGVLHRFLGPLFGLTLLFMLSYRNSWGMIFHNQNLLVLDALILGFSASAHRFSIDAWLVRRWPGLRSTLGVPKEGVEEPSAGGQVAHWRYGWPIRLLCWATALAYFLAGVAKIDANAGLSWVSGENLRDQVAYNALAYEMIGEGAGDLSWQLYNATFLFTILAMSSLIFEVFAPLVLFHRRAGALWAVLTWSMHWGIRIVMGIHFPFQLYGVAFAPFFDLEGLTNRWRRTKV